MKYFIALAAFLSVFFALLPEPQQPRYPSERFVLRDVRLFDGKQVRESQDVLVEDGKVKQIGQALATDAEAIDGKGKTLLPGLIDAHTHVWGGAAKQALNFGVTTEMDMFAMPNLINPLQKRRDDPSNIAGSDVYSATILATAPNGHGTEYGFKIPVLSGPQDAEAFVQQRIAQGADYIKIVYDGSGGTYQFYPSIDRATLVTVVTQAHKYGKLAVVHIDNLQSAKEAVAAGADGLAHSFMDEVIDDELIKMMQKRQVFVIPTLTAEASLATLMPGKALLEDSQLAPYIDAEQRATLKAPFMALGFGPEDYQNAKASVALWQKAGIRILAGTDAPNPGMAHGVSLHQELAKLVDAGLTPLQALRSATGNVNQSFDIGYRGTIAPGTPATFVLVEGDPTQNIKQTRQITALWKNGRSVARTKADLEQMKSRPAPSGLIADFNDGEMKPKWGKAFTTTVDTIVNGKSEASVTLDDGGFVTVSGEVRPGFAFPWAGVQFNPGQPADLSQIKRLHFRAKGNLEHLVVLLFQKGSYQPQAQTVALDKQWQDFYIEINGFTNADLTQVTALAWVASGVEQPFEFAIDDIELK